MNVPEKQGFVSWLWFSLCILVLALFIFHAVLNPSNVLFSTDDNIGAISQAKQLMPQSFLAWWSDSPLIGNSGFHMACSWTDIFLLMLPANDFINWIHAIDLIAASLFLGLYLRKRGLHWVSCLMAALVACWLGSNLTLTYAGHIRKFGTLMFASFALWGIVKTMETRRLAWSFLTGGALGFMLIEQQDLAIFFGLFLGLFALYEMIRVYGWVWKPILTLLAPMGVCAFLIFSSTLGFLTMVNENGAESNIRESPQQKWEFITQWSWPPEESIDFIAPGYTGWRSGEPDGPYWGRMGRSAGWEQTGQGFQNFKLENQYIGVIPIVFALFAVFMAVTSRKTRQDLPGVYKPDILFWSGATLLALLLSFGKYFPLYWFVYHLPAFSVIRNPNKFLQVFQLALGIVAGYGLDTLIRRTRIKDDGTSDG